MAVVCLPWDVPETVADHLAGRTALVTGGAGFLGSHIAETLVAVDGVDVRVLDDCSSGQAAFVPDEALFVEGDVCDEGTLARAMDGVDVVFHEAAIVGVPESVEHPLETHDINARGSLQVLQRARTEDARVVLASSAAVYGSPSTVPVAEDDRTAPLSPYGVQKLAADRYAVTYADLYGLPTVALRYFNVYGPRQSGGQYSGVIDVFRRQARAGEPLTVHGDGGQTRDFVHVADVVRANLRAAVADATGEAYNVGTGDAVSVRELAETVRDLVDPSLSITHTDPRSGDVRQSCADVTKARDGLDFSASVPLSEGLEALLRTPNNV